MFSCFLVLFYALICKISPKTFYKGLKHVYSSYCHTFTVFHWIFKVVWMILCPKSAKMTKYYSFSVFLSPNSFMQCNNSWKILEICGSSQNIHVFTLNKKFFLDILKIGLKNTEKTIFYHFFVLFMLLSLRYPQKFFAKG